MRLFTVLVAAPLVAALVALTYAEPPGLALVRVIDQYNRTVSSLVQLEVLGGEAYRLNATHWAVRCEAPVPARVLLYNVTVWQGTLEPGKAYVVKAGVVEMVVWVPDPSLVAEVELVGSQKSWRLVGKREYRLYPVPVGTYRVVVHGATVAEKTVYFTGGTIDVTGSIEYRPAFLPLLALALAPAAAYTGYRAAKRGGRSGPLSARPRTLLKASKPQKKVKPTQPKIRTKLGALREGVRRKTKLTGRKPAKPSLGRGERRKARRLGTIADLLESLPG